MLGARRQFATWEDVVLALDRAGEGLSLPIMGL